MAEPVGCVPERLHLFPREEGCRGRHGEAAIVTRGTVAAAAADAQMILMIMTTTTMTMGQLLLLLWT